MKKTIILGMLLCAITTQAQNSPAQVKEYLKTFPTYPFSDPSPLPQLSELYPYFRFDGFTDQAVQKKWKVVELENDYLRLLILPEIGGKIWAAIEKSTGRSFLYYNHAVKFRDVAMRGPWTSGGIEANYGIIGHTPNCATPVDYQTRSNADGSVSCFIGSLDLLSNSYWRMEINLPKDQAVFTTRSIWYNTTPLEQPYYHWMNAGLKAAGNLEFIYPGNKYLGHNGEYSEWPIDKSNGKNLSFYKDNDFGGYKSYHVFGKYTEFSGAYWHDDDFGMVRYAAHDDKPGKKIWIWGLSRQGMIWDKLLTDSDGQYVELQSGRLFNQNTAASSQTPFKHISFAPYGTEQWTESWYPVIGTKGFVTANPFGALNIRYQDGWLKISFSPVQPIHDTLYTNVSGHTIRHRFLSLRPLQLYTDSLKINLNPDSLQVILGNQLLRYDAAAAADSLSRPVETVKVAGAQSAYGFYVMAKQAADMKSYPEAESLFERSLGADSNFLPALSALAQLYYRNMRYAESLALLLRALQIDTEDPAANFYYGLVNEKLGRETDARDGFDIASLDPGFRSAACTELARIYLKRKEYPRAIGYTMKALDAHASNMEALQLQAVLYRLSGQQKKAEEVLETIGRYDPLSHILRFEHYLWTPDKAHMDLFISGIRSELPAEILLQTGIWYQQLGLSETALQVFRAGPANAELKLWIAWLSGSAIDFQQLDPVRSFPFRSETGWLLENLIKTTPHWFLKYQLALIYQDRNRLKESARLLAECKNEPAFAPFYLFRSMTGGEGDSVSRLADLQRAVQLDPQWRYQKALAEYHIAHHQYDTAQSIAGTYYRSHTTDYIMGMLFARTLLLNRQYEKGDQVLSKLNIIPFEGATTGRELYREAKLMQAVKWMKEKSYDKALVFISQARQWPEHLGVGEPYAKEEDLRLEEWMTYACYKKKNDTAQADTALRDILAFEPKIDNTVPNFILVNAVVSAWAHDINHQGISGAQYLDSQQKPWVIEEQMNWMRAAYARAEVLPAVTSRENANMRIIAALIPVMK